MVHSHFSVANHFPVEVIKSDNNGGPATEKQALIGSQAELDQFFDGAAPIAIDFTQGFIFAIALGERRTTGFAVNVTNISQDTNGIMAGVVTVTYEETMPQGSTGDQITNPYTIVHAVGLEFATNIFFRKIAATPPKQKVKMSGSGSKFIVIALTGSNTGCQILPDDAIYLQIYSQVFGPVSIAECEAWVAANCRDHGLGGAPVEL